MSAGPVLHDENPDPTHTVSSGSRPAAWMLPLLLAATIAALWPALRGALVWDDLEVVGRNPWITSWARLPELFSTAASGPSGADTVHWRPLASVTLLIGHRLGNGDPLWFHVLSLALHLVATAVAFRLAWRLSASAPVAFFASLLFGLHPVHVESVAWISAISDPLFGLFALLSIDAFVAWRDRGSVGWDGKSALYFGLALLSNEIAIAVVPIVLAIDFARRRLFSARAYGPLLAVLSLYFLARVAVFRDLSAGFDRSTIDFGVGAGRLALLRVELLGGFIGLLAWPFELNLFRAFVPARALADPVMLSALACIAALAAALWFAHKRRAIAALAAALFIPAALLPVLVRVGSLGRFPLAERHLYLPVLGFTLLLALATFRALPARVATLMLALVALVYGVRSFHRTEFWRDEETLFTIAAADNPKSPFVELGLGRVLLQKYRGEKTGDTLRRAHAAYEKSLDLLDAAQSGDETIFATIEDHVQANLGYGWSFLYEAEVDEQHDFNTASEVFKKVAERYPLSAAARTSLGVAHSQMNEIAEAEQNFGKALELDPAQAEAYRGLGLLELRRGDRKKAAANFERALELRPDSLEDALLFAGALGDGGEIERAVAVAERARARHPEAPGPLAMLGTLAAQKGDIEGATKYAQRALELAPDDGKSLLLKGKLQLARGEFAGAQRSLQRAADLLPTNFEVHHNVAALFLRNQNFEAALPYLLRAYDCRPAGADGDLLRDTLIKMEIQDPDTLCKLGAIDAQHGRESEASAWMEKALAVKPEHGPTHFLKGSLAKKRGDREAAAAEWRKACMAMPDSAAANEFLGLLLVEMKQPDEALPHLEKALAISTRAPVTDEMQKSAIEMLRETIARLKNEKH